jgi:ABC-type sugar transport system ATPase subunit
MTKVAQVLALNGVDVSYRMHTGWDHVLKGLELSVFDRDLVVIIGDSGSGKSTLLNVIAGFVRPRLSELPWQDRFVSSLGFEDVRCHGRISFLGESSEDLSPRDRPIGLVMQRFCLYRHMTVRQNLEFPLRMGGVAAHRREELIHLVAKQLQISELLGRKADALSGGQEQRVAIGKMLLRFPAVALLDEAFSNLDYELRAELRRGVIDQFLRGSSLPEASACRAVIFVSHNLEDAVEADAIIVLTRTERMAEAGVPSSVEVFRTDHLRKASAWEQLRASGRIRVLQDLAVGHDERQKEH